MKAISGILELKRVSPLTDRSATISLGTGELSPEELVAWVELMGSNVRVLVEPADTAPTARAEMQHEPGHKTPAQRLRSVLFVAWRQRFEGAEDKPQFDDYYRNRMERLIDGVKEELDD